MLHSKIVGHYSQAYDAQLNALVVQLLEMGALVEVQLSDAIHAFLEGDKELAEKVVATDLKVNQFEVDIDEHCIDILALRQPAASDLRLVIAVLKVINDIERIGDLSESIAKQLLHEKDGRPNEDQLTDISLIGERAKKILKQGLECFQKMDAQDALSVLRQDKSIDKDYARIVRLNLTYMLEDPTKVSHALEIIWIARSLERIGDHVRNICQYAIFLSKGENVSHSSDEEMQNLIEK